MTRATFVRPLSPDGDADAQSRLCAGMKVPVLADRIPSLRARTRFFDDEVMAAIASDIGQIVILGAGYDDRSLRFHTPGVRFFELDHPATQHDKARRLRTAAAGADPAILAPCDFARDDAGAVLAEAGHDPDRPSLFVAEGLLVYLDQTTIVALLEATRARAGSRLAASLAVHPDGVVSDRVRAVANEQRRTADREPWLTILPIDAHLRLISGAGWLVERAVDQADLEPDSPAGRSLLVAAASELAH